MSNRVLFIVTGTGKIDEKTKKSLDANLDKEDAKVFVKYGDIQSEEYYTLKDEVNKIVNDVNNFDYVCLLPNGSELNSSAKQIFNEYVSNRSEEFVNVFLPFVFYKTDIVTVLNKHLWNSMIASVPGVLDIDLALKQIDSTMFGAFIPTGIFFDENNYKPGMKYYQQYFFLNSIASSDDYVITSIPKIILNVADEWDFKFSAINNEEKVKYFTMARENWAEDKQTTTVESN